MDDKRLQEILERCDKATKGLDCPLVASTMVVCSRKYANCAESVENTEGALAVRDAKPTRLAVGARRMCKRRGIRFAGPTTSGKQPILVMRRGGRGSSGKTIQSTTGRNLGNALRGWLRGMSPQGNFGIFKRRQGLSAFTAKERSIADVIRETQEGSIISSQELAADATPLRTSSFVAGRVTQSNLTTKAARTDIPDLLAEIERLKALVPKTTPACVVDVDCNPKQ